MIDQIIEILFEEDNSRIVAIYGGGFKPPTKGHFSVVEKTLEDFPEIDELKIFVGGGVRDGITQDKSIKLWDIYTKYLTPKIDIQSSIAPVKSILDYSKEHPDEKIYWILGVREGNEDDLKDLESRTKSLEKYPNIEVKVITTTGGISGTKARAALLSGNKEEFFKLIPNIEEKEQVWDLLTPVVKEEEITEVGEANLKPYEWKELARNSYYIYTAFTTDNGTEYEVDLKPTLHIDKDFNDVSALSVSFYAKPTDTDRSSAYITVNKGELYKVMSTITDIIKTYAKEFKAGAIIYSPVKKSDEENFGTQRDKLYKAFISKAIPGVEFEQGEEVVTAVLPKAINEVGEANLKPYEWEETNRGYGVTVAKFITDNKVQYSVILQPDYLNKLKTLEIEFSAKLEDEEGSSSKIIVNKGELYRVMATIADIVKTYVKKFNTQAIIYSPSKKSNEEDFGLQRDKLYKAFISKAIPGVKFEQGENWLNGTQTIAILPNNAALTLNEGKQVGPLYHYTSADGLKSILNSNRINASEEYYLGNDLYYISFTRNKNFHNKGSKFGVKTDYRITLDGDKLSNRYKITPFAYKPGWNYKDNWEYDWLEDEPESVVRDFFNNTGDYDEQEERISFKGPEGGIDNIKNYILAVDKVEDLQETVTATKIICDNCGWEWKKTDGGKDLYICHKCGHDNTPNKDPFGLKEYAREFVKEVFKEDRNIKEGMLSLSKYMVNNGMNIKPLPKVKIIDNDAKNASDLLGKTAYYNPQEKSITLYTMNRHPKDVLRSFAHEMVHHQQNLEGRLNNINTTNTNEDGDLPEIEREAYEKGNMMFRNWEDSIKNV